MRQVRIQSMQPPFQPEHISCDAFSVVLFRYLQLKSSSIWVSAGRVHCLHICRCYSYRIHFSCISLKTVSEQQQIRRIRWLVGRNYENILFYYTRERGRLPRSLTRGSCLGPPTARKCLITKCLQEWGYKV